MAVLGISHRLQLALALILGTMIWFAGPMPVLLIFLPTTIVAGTVGVWLFYVQHQFEETHWANGDEWRMQDAALAGSSHSPPAPASALAVRGILGVSHVSTACTAASRSVAARKSSADHDELASAQRLTLRESLRSVNLHLWDENRRRLMSFHNIVLRAYSFSIAIMTDPMMADEGLLITPYIRKSGTEYWKKTR